MKGPTITGPVKNGEVIDGQPTLTGVPIEVPGSGPMFDGHFPGSPILPGARLLDLILQAMRLERVELQTVKFLATVAPASRLQLDWTTDAAGRISFECRQPAGDAAAGPGAPAGMSGADAHGGRLVATGKLRAL